ncbi:MAG: erythromycin esterase family protein, partial [Chloroflexi bacterium]|nr:erythromycin esterase family protein [Chloroflexota bacterium]
RYNCLRTVRADYPDYSDWPAIDQVACQVGLQQVYDDLQRNRAAYEAASSPSEYARALHSARTVLQAEDWSALKKGDAKDRLRADYLAENVHWLLAQAGADTKMVLWGHSDQLALNPGGRPSLSGRLREQFGISLAVIGLDFYRGSLRTDGPQPVMLSEPPVGSYEQFLHSANLPRFTLNLHDISPRLPAFAWFNEPRPLRADDAAKPDSHFYAARLLNEFDALVFFQNVSAALPTIGAFGQDPTAAARLQSLPAQARNLDFESGLLGWQFDPTVDGNVGIDELNGRTGRNSLHLKAHGNLAYVQQELRANDYRGKRVRFSAYLKSENIEGWAGLMVGTRALSLPSSMYEDTQLRPITGTHDWHKVEIVFDVPIDYDVISFGVQLNGTGQLWADDLQLEVVSSEVPLTYLQGWPDTPSNLDFEQGKTNWEFFPSATPSE